MTGPRDWDKELADIDKIIAATPAPSAPAKGGAVVPAAGPAAAAPRSAPAAAPAGRGSFVGTWFRLLLAGLLAVALPIWPFIHTCGTGLALYLGAVGMTAFAGLWAATASWAARRSTAHVLSLLVIVWAGTLAAIEVLPRTGYARQVASWSCAP